MFLRMKILHAFLEDVLKVIKMPENAPYDILRLHSFHTFPLYELVRLYHI